MILKFRQHVYEGAYVPYYDKYKNHYFMVDHFHPDDESKKHVWLKCFSDENLIVDGYVELSNLEEVALTSKKLEDWSLEDRESYTKIFRKFELNG